MLATGTKLGSYEILAPLGKGGMGEVYRVRDTRLKREVAIKILPAALAADAGRLRRFEQEARAASALNHPNIITVHEIGESGAGRFIVMELVEGLTLRAMIGQSFAADSLARLGSQIAKALSVAHNAGITHRDIKPENIMLRNDGYVKVLDFGLARLVPAKLDKEAVTLQDTNPGGMLGTIAYMSPEQARGESAGHSSDIFSLGLIFYEIATGKHPFMMGSVFGTLNAIVAQAPIPPSRLNPDLPAAIETLILQMLEKDARLRPSAAAVDQTLQETGRQADGVTGRGSAASPRRSSIGREKEMAELRAGFTSAAVDKGLLLCVAGEPGIGKTTLVEDFLDELAAKDQVCLMARGRCSERLAGTEAYLPWLETLDSLLRGADKRSRERTLASGDESIARTMKRLAPTWYAKVAPIQSHDSSAERSHASSQERMKREFGALLEAISRRQPIVLFFDDLHWADASTIDLLAYVAGKFEKMHVLIIATYRTTDLLLAKHPFLKLKPDLQAHGVCREIALDFLSREEVEKYLALAFPENRFPDELPALIHARTEGNPLFMADLAHDLRESGVIAARSGHWTLAQPLPDLERELPESVRGMIERKIGQLIEEDRRLLVAASVQGNEFDSAVVAKMLHLDPADVEERLEALERVYALVRLVSEKEFPGRVLTLRYRFVHLLYQNALYASLRPTRKAQLSAAAAESLIEFYGRQSETVASELAFLFEAARDWSQAYDHYLIAAHNASKVFANEEAGALAGRGLETLRLLPETDERAKQELKLQMVLGPSLMAARGFAAPEVEQAFIRACELCLRLDERAQLFHAQFSLAIVYVVKAEYERAYDQAGQCLRLAESLRDSAMLVQSHWVMGLSDCYLARLDAARRHFEQTLAIHDAERIDSPVSLYGAVLSRAHLARMLLYLGYPDQSDRLINEALAEAGRLRHPVGFANTLSLAAQLEVFHRHAPNTEELAKAMTWHAEEHGLPYYAAIAVMMRGWALAMQGREESGIALIREGLTSYLATGTRQQHAYFLALLAEALNEAGRVSEGLESLAAAIEAAKQSGEHYYEAELHRLRGELLLDCRLQTADCGSEAEACFQQALSVARDQNAKLLELRAVMRLSRLRQKQDKREEARAMLAEIHGWFTEGYDTRDLKEAKALLDELS